MKGITGMASVLMTRTLKPYWKLGKLIQHAVSENIISEEEGEAFNEELDLLTNGNNRSSNSWPRIYADKEPFKVLKDKLNEYKDVRLANKHPLAEDIF